MTPAETVLHLKAAILAQNWAALGDILVILEDRYGEVPMPSDPVDYLEVLEHLLARARRIVIAIDEGDDPQGCLDPECPSCNPDLNLLPPEPAEELFVVTFPDGHEMLLSSEPDLTRMPGGVFFLASPMPGTH